MTQGDDAFNGGGSLEDSDSFLGDGDHGEGLGSGGEGYGLASEFEGEAMELGMELRTRVGARVREREKDTRWSSGE